MAALALVASAAALYVSAARWVEHTRDVQCGVDAWTLMVLEVQSASRGFVASGRPEFLEEIPRLLAKERAAVALAAAGWWRTTRSSLPQSSAPIVRPRPRSPIFNKRMPWSRPEALRWRSSD